MSSTLVGSGSGLGLKVVRSRDHIPLEKRGSLTTSESFNREQTSFLVSCASAASLADVIPVLELPPPPDGGWGWVIVFASFMCNLILDGLAYSFGVLLVPLVEHFGSSRSKVSWVGSLLCGVYMGSGPLVGGLVNKYGCRPVCIWGGIVACISLLLSTVSPNVPTLMLTYGIMGGFGLGLVYLPSVIACGYYFERRRALATGISVCGSGVGCFAFAPLANFLLETYGWKGANIIFAGLCLNCCVFGALMRPLELSVQEDAHTQPPQDPESTMVVQLPDGTSGAIKRGSISNASGLGASAPRPPAIPTINTLMASPHHSLSLLNEEIIEEDEEDGFEEGLPPTMTAKPTSDRLQNRRRTLSETPNKMPAPLLPRNQSNPKIRRNVSTPGFGRLARVPGLDHPPDTPGKEHIYYGVHDGTHLLLSPSRRGSHALVRPMSRKDIFYSGSVLHLAEEHELPSTPPNQLMSRYRHSVISMPRGSARLSIPRGSIVASHLSIRKDAIDPELLSVKLSGDSNALLRVLREMVDVSLFSNLRFVLICLSNVLGFLALYVPYVYLPNMIVMRGMSMQQASLVISAIGISNTVGRVLIGYLVDFPFVDSLVVTNLSLIGSGLCVLGFTVCQNFVPFVLVAVAFGLSVSAYISLTSIVLVDLLGLDVLTSAFGLLVSFRGVASVLGPPLAGLVYEATDDYNMSFFMAASFFLAAGVISQGAHFLQRRRNVKGK